MAEHAELSASTAKRWMLCPGSVGLIRNAKATGLLLEDRRSNRAAREGTAAHALAAKVMLEVMTDPENTGLWTADRYLGQDVYLDAEDNTLAISGNTPKEYDISFPVNEDMVTAVNVYLDTIYATWVELGPGTEVFIERKFDISHLVQDLGENAPKLFGTCDACLLQPFGQVIAFDYKHGRGIPVEIGELGDYNPQLMFYGLGIISTFADRDIEELKIGIVQPRCPHGDGSIRQAVISLTELQIWADHFKTAVAATLPENNPQLNPGHDQCQWCPVFGQCKAARDYAITSAQADFSDESTITVPDPSLMNDIDLARALEFTSYLDNFVRAVRAEATTRVMTGRSIQGLKIVRGRCNRKIPAENEAVIIEKVKDILPNTSVIYQPVKLKSAAQLEKLGCTTAQRKAMKALITTVAVKPEGPLKVVSEKDPRPGIDPKFIASLSDDEFEEENDGEETS